MSLVSDIIEEQKARLVTEALTKYWKRLREDRTPTTHAFVRGAISVLREVALLSEDDEKQWLKRIATCPGHEDDPRSTWCEYCGDRSMRLDLANPSTRRPP